MQQRSEAWYTARRTRVGASDSSSIMGMNPYKDVVQLWKEKKGKIPEQPINERMQRGINLESDALDWYCSVKEIEFDPKVLFHKEHPEKIMASLDGMSSKGDIVEIKVSNKIFAKAQKGIIDPLYKCQMQHQLMVAGADRMDFCAYDGFEGIIIPVERDQAFIDKLLPKCLEFWDYLQGDVEPPLYKTYIQVELDDFNNNLVNSWIDTQRQIKRLQDLEKSIKASLIDLGDDGDFELVYHGKPRLTLKRIVREGNVDWAGVCKEMKIDPMLIEKHRKEEIGYYKLTEA